MFCAGVGELSIIKFVFIKGIWHGHYLFEEAFKMKNLVSKVLFDIFTVNRLRKKGENMKKFLLIGSVLSLFLVDLASAGTITWTDWQSAIPNTTVYGDLGGIAVTYTGNYSFVQLGDGTGDGTNYWTEPNSSSKPYTGNIVIDNAPTGAEMIALNGAASHSITFGSAVIDPVMTFVSVGSPIIPVTYNFDQPFTLLSNGVGYWSWANPGGGPGDVSLVGNSLTGSEFHGAIQFHGTLSSISWSSLQDENWQGFTVGVPGAPVPEPATMILFGTGIIGLAGLVRRRKK